MNILTELENFPVSGSLVKTFGISPKNRAKIIPMPTITRLLVYSMCCQIVVGKYTKGSHRKSEKVTTRLVMPAEIMDRSNPAPEAVRAFFDRFLAILLPSSFVFLVRENFMVHYNFPGFSVGEASPVMGTKRRELGHGNLAKRALESSIDLDGQTVRLVSEVLESNGSSSMATVCGGYMALRAADIPVSDTIAGIAMGMVSEGDKYAILSDIMGLEDHDGDMDFKVTGSKSGITAMQMDIKLGGVSLNILKEALYQAKEGRSHIIDIMIDAESKIEFNEGVLPSVEMFHIDPSFIGEIIGQAGKTIREMIEKFEVAIDIDKKDGKVKITGKNKNGVNGAKDHIHGIVNAPKVEKIKYEVGDKHEGTVKKIVDFGAFIELPDGTDGLLHISKISDQRVDKVSDVLTEGEKIMIEILEFKGNKISLGRA